MYFETIRKAGPARTASLTLGLYAGVLGIAHGVFELRQGALRPAGLMINAIGAPCQPETVYHACWPALTLIPNIALSGLLAILFSALALIWLLIGAQHRRGALPLALLALAMLPVGAGFLPPFYMLLSAAVASFRGTTARRSAAWLAALWPWLFLPPVLWIATELLFGQALSAFLLRFGGVMLPLQTLLLLIALAAAIAREREQGRPPMKLNIE